MEKGKGKFERNWPHGKLLSGIHYLLPDLQDPQKIQSDTFLFNSLFCNV